MRLERRTASHSCFLSPSSSSPSSFRFDAGGDGITGARVQRDGGRGGKLVRGGGGERGASPGEEEDEGLNDDDAGLF